MEATPFGHYELKELLGKGGMGEVYRAFDTKTDRVVALKVLPAHLAEDVNFQRRFRRESQAVAGLNDPHVVPIHGYGEIDGRLYLDMRLIEGHNLGTIVAQDVRRRDPEFAVKVVEQVASALDTAHAAGLIHRDVKPSNILITDRGFAYLIDFGLARTAGEPGVTTAGNTLGTLAYMAPERLEGGEVGASSDTYALACVLYECLTGARPYPADSLEQQIAAHIAKAPPRPSDVDARLASFDEVIAKGMAKKPSHRYRSAGELAMAARRALTTPVRSVSGSGRHAARRAAPSGRVPWRAAAAAGVVLLVVAAAAIGVWQWRSGRDGPSNAATTAPVAMPLGAVPDIAAGVPADIRAGGKLVVGVNLPYPPNEFRDASGAIVGFDVDLLNAVARTLGLTVEFRESGFEAIIPSVRAGDFHLGMSSFTDTKERQKLVDFVNYFQAGTWWAQRVGSGIDPMSACGLRVGVTYAALQDTTEIPAKSEDCVAAGNAPIEKVVFVGQDELTKALIDGAVDAMSADSPATGFAIKISGGVLEPAGEIFDTAPYGWPVAKGSALAESLLRGLEHVMQTGEYRTIATIWGVDKGMIDKPVINGAA